MNTSDMRSGRVRFLIDLAYWAAIAVIVYGAFRFINALLPLLLAFLLSAAVRPVSHFLSRETKIIRNERGERVVAQRRFHLNPTLAGVLSVLVLFTVLGGLLTLLIFRAATSVAELAAGAPDFYENSLLPGLHAIYDRLRVMGERADLDFGGTLGSFLPNIVSSVGATVTSLSGRIVGALTSLAAKLPNFLLTTLITMIATVFFAVDYDRIKGFLRSNIPQRPLHYIMTVRSSFVDMMGRFLRSYALIMLITSVENVVGLWLIGVDNPVLIGCIIGVVDIFPVVGSGTILIPWGIICLVIGDYLRGVLLLVLYLVITVIRQILEPRIVGKRVGLRPIVTLACMYAGARLFGGVGLFAVPIMAAILVDLNNSGVLHIFHETGNAADKENIRTEGIDA